MKTLKLSQLNQFDILFWKASFKKPIGWMIRKVTGDEVNHVGWYIGTKAGFYLAFESISAGPSLNEICGDYTPKYVGRLKDPLTDIEKTQLIIELHKLAPKKYDFAHIIGYYLGWDSPDRLMCAELINEPLELINRSLRRENERPGGIFESPDLEIFELVKGGR